MNIAVCDDQAEELETVTELLRQWQAQRRCPLHFRTFRSAAQCWMRRAGSALRCICSM